MGKTQKKTNNDDIDDNVQTTEIVEDVEQPLTQIGDNIQEQKSDEVPDLGVGEIMVKLNDNIAKLKEINSSTKEGLSKLQAINDSQRTDEQKAKIEQSKVTFAEYVEYLAQTDNPGKTSNLFQPFGGSNNYPKYKCSMYNGGKFIRQ